MLSFISENYVSYKVSTKRAFLTSFYVYVFYKHLCDFYKQLSAIMGNMIEDFIDKKKGLLDDRSAKQLRMQWLEFAPDTDVRSAMKFNALLGSYGYGYGYKKFEGKTVRVYVKGAPMPMRTEKSTCWCGHEHYHPSYNGT